MVNRTRTVKHNIWNEYKQKSIGDTCKKALNDLFKCWSSILCREKCGEATLLVFTGLGDLSDADQGHGDPSPCLEDSDQGRVSVRDYK